MNILEVQQGSADWLAARAQHFCASEAPAAMGVSKFISRGALLRQKKTGITPDVSSTKQRLFDAGHAAEADARPLAEAIAGTELYPVTATAVVDGLPLLASFDGVDMGEQIVWENKLRNAELERQVEAGNLDPHYWAQLEQQLLVSGAQRVLFTVSDGTNEGTRHLWYESVPERRQQVLSAWRQFAADLEGYEAPAEAVAPVAQVIDPLPALVVSVEGRVVSSNLHGFQAAATRFLARIKTELQTDQDFADAERTVGFCQDAENRLDLVKEQALTGSASIAELLSTIDVIKEQVRDKRLFLNRLVESRKKAIRAEIVGEGQAALDAHIVGLNTRLGTNWLPRMQAPFGEVIKGKRTIATLKDAVATLLANSKIEANERADRLQVNRESLKRGEDDYYFLFADFATEGVKPAADFSAIAEQRIQKHKAAEQARIERAAEQQRQAEAARVAHERGERLAKAYAAAEGRAGRDRADAVFHSYATGNNGFTIPVDKTDEYIAALNALQPEPDSQRQESGAQPSGDAGNMAHQTAQAAPGGGSAEGAAAPAAAAPGSGAWTAERVSSPPWVGTVAPNDPQPEAATVKLGDINAKLGFPLTAVFVRDTLGVTAAVIKTPAHLYTPSQVATIKTRLLAHIAKAL